MTGYYTLKHWYKLGRWQLRRAQCALRWGISAQGLPPAVFGNAMPKSGSHLIIQVLEGLTRLGPFVNPGFPPVNRFEDNRTLPSSAILANIRRMLPGDIRYGYVQAREPFISALTGPGRATVFVYRDPRDMLVSHVFYATELHKGHGMHEYYNQALDSMEARLNAAIQGVQEPGFELSSVRQRYDRYQGWLNQPDVLCLRFEDLISNQRASLERLLDYIQTRGEYKLDLAVHQAIDILQQAIDPKRSGTFRKGQPGNWREHFTDTNKVLFKKVSGDLLIRLGYEHDHNW